VEDRPAVFHAIHDVAHPGIRATRRMLSARFVWKGVGKDVAAMCRACQQCQRGKVHKQPAAPVQAIPVPARKFSHVHVDLVGPRRGTCTCSPSSTGLQGGLKQSL
jgi:hypothetical protein